MSQKQDVKPFTIHIPDGRFDDLMSRLKRWRCPDDFGNDDWRYGYNTARHREMVRYRINEHARRTADIENAPIKDVLGHERHATAGGDRGAPIARQQGHTYAKDVIGLHTHFRGLR